MRLNCLVLFVLVNSAHLVKNTKAAVQLTLTPAASFQIDHSNRYIKYIQILSAIAMSSSLVKV